MQGSLNPSSSLVINDTCGTEILWIWRRHCSGWIAIKSKDSWTSVTWTYFFCLSTLLISSATLLAMPLSRVTLQGGQWFSPRTRVTGLGELRHPASYYRCQVTNHYSSTIKQSCTGILKQIKNIKQNYNSNFLKLARLWLITSSPCNQSWVEFTYKSLKQIQLFFLSSIWWVDVLRRIEKLSKKMLLNQW